MSADAPIVSRPFHPKMACPACVWKRGAHAEWCVTPTPELPEPMQEFMGRLKRDAAEPLGGQFQQTYFTATEQQNQAYERMVAARMMKDKTSAITAAVRIASESLPDLPKEPWLTAEQQTEMRRGLPIHQHTASPWADPWAKRKE